MIAKGSLPVPNHLRTAGDRRMKHHGIGVGYVFPHDFEGDDVEQQYLPDELAGRRYYVPTDQGHEATIAARMAAPRERPPGPSRARRAADPPMAGMSDALRPREENRKKLAGSDRRQQRIGRARPSWSSPCRQTVDQQFGSAKASRLIECRRHVGRRRRDAARVAIDAIQVGDRRHVGPDARPSRASPAHG